MKKGRYYIRLNEGCFEEVEGKTGEFFGTMFGCHKNKYGNYVITHLKTGAKVITEDRMKDATDAITEELCEKIKEKMREDPKKWNALAKEMSKFYKDHPIGELKKDD